MFLYFHKVKKFCHFQGYATANESLEMATALGIRYNELKNPCMIRRENLNDALAFYGWISEAEEQSEWLSDRKRQTISTDYGDTLHAVQLLAKRHAHLEADINSRRVRFLVCNLN